MRKHIHAVQDGANFQRARGQSDRGPCLEPLEPRLYLSGDAAGSDAAAPVDAPADADAIVVETAEYAGGTGSESDPYQIDTAQALQHLCVTPAEWSLHFVLLEDVDLAGAELTPIGSETAPFTGVFDGQGHAIRNGIIDQVDTPYVGLFGWVGEGGSVDHLGLESVSVSGSVDLGDFTYVGGLAGRNRGTITDCYTTGPVGGREVVGGLVSVNDGTIANCYATGAVSGARYVGGLAGISYGTITGCHAAGPITGARYVGGLVGASIEGEIADSYAIGAVNGGLTVGGLVGSCGGTVTNCYAAGDVVGEDFVGGLFGGSSAVITCCYATGVVHGTWIVGGLTGSFGGVMSDCYTMGSVVGERVVGGLIGRCSGTVANCYFAGALTGYSTIGGLVAENTGAVTSCFWDAEASGQATSAGGVGKTTAEMKQQTTFTNAGWDFDSIWWMPEGDYPSLIWQLSQDQLPDTPVGQSPADGATDVSLTPTLTSSPFSDLDLGDTHAATQWQIDDSEDFATPVWDYRDVNSDKTSEAVPSGVLTYNTTYRWRVRYQDSKGGWSQWSAPMQFATITAPYVSISVSPSSVAEDGSTNLVYTFTRSTMGSGSITVNFTVGGTASYGADYTATGAARFTATAGTVRIPAGRKSVTVTINPTADPTLEPDETVVLTVQPGTGYSVGTPGAATGTVLTDEEATWIAPADAHGIRNMDGELILLDFLSIMSGTEDRTVLEFDVRDLGGTPRMATLHLYVRNLDSEPPAGRIDVYAFNGNGVV
ncbi:MAG: GLUG motif-containing protein, partial [Solirubrobacterales bacterium]